ncbi:type II toxin-antitoxin system VapC family toxin [Pseudorhodoplanes sp.]|uniref:type II toxin-antitoxin system VapC family toxin n=1 Tax=Pseudorhodoplanes sp. TaxID=1934341 RepID=UPI003D0DD972
MDRRYWDSDCFLGYLMAEQDKVADCEQVLQAAEDGKVIIVTSALTIAEVLALRGRDPIPTANREKVEQFFRNEYIAVHNITRRISETARSFVWDYRVKPKDALHVATAIDAGLSLMNSFDKPLSKKSGKIGTPPLVIVKPAWVEPKLPMDLPHDKSKK